MNIIVTPDESFDFSKITLSKPIRIQGDAYFSKIEFQKKSLYIQSCKTFTKQGIVQSGKNYYCDLMLDKYSEKIIHWFEQLEEICHKLILEKNSEWFQNSLHAEDLTSTFNSVMRVYRSGKYYLVRCNIKTNSDSSPSVKVYHENKNKMSYQDIKDDTNIISILEIQGIKITESNFQIEIELKQAMILSSEDDLFENCLIDHHNNVTIAPMEKNTHILKAAETTTSKLEFATEIKPPITTDDNHPITIDDTNLGELTNIELDFKDDLDEETQLEAPNKIYMDLYKEARKKAKEAKKNAILAFLEAKNIRKTYLLEDIDKDDEDDIDEEIADVSESDLEDM